MALNLANEFTERGYPSLLIVSRNLGSLSSLVADQESIRFLGKTKTLDSKAFQKLLKCLDDFKVDILHAHGPSVYWGIAVRIFRPSIKLIWHDHLGISPEVIANNPRKEIKWIKSWVDFVITANESTRVFWLSKGYWKSDKIKFLPNFPALETLPKSKNQTFTFVHLANFRDEKGHLLVLQASAILKSRNLDFMIKMVGKEVDPAWKALISKELESLDLGSFIQLAGESNHIAELLANSDAGLVASDREGLPVALLEYGLAGLPVISTRVGQCTEVLEGGKFGILVNPGNPTELASAMEKMILNPDKFQNLGLEFQSHVKTNYGSGQFFQDYITMVRELTSNSKAS